MSNLKAVKRDRSTSGTTNKLRSSGFIPAILYGGKDPNQKIELDNPEVVNYLLEEMSQLMKKADAPQELFERLKLNIN